MASEQKITALLTVNSAQLNAQKITNNLLSDVLNAQIKTNGLLGAQNAITKRRISADKFARQENAIEKFRQKKAGGSLKDKVKLPGKINWKNVLGLGALALGVGALVTAIDGVSNGLAGFADRIDGIAQGLEDFEVKVRETASKVRDFLTPIAGFSMFGLRQASMGVDAAKSGRYATTGRQVRGAVGRGIVRGAKRTGNLALDGVQSSLNKVAGTNTAALADKLDDISIRQGARAGSTTLPTGITPKGVIGGLKNSIDEMLFDARLTARAADPSKSVAARFQNLVSRGGNAARSGVADITRQPKLFMQGLTGAPDASVLRTANRPFPNIARGAGSLADEAGGFFRAGRGIRTGAQSIASGKALQDLMFSLRQLKGKTITDLSRTFKALPGQVTALGKATTQLGKNAKTAIANFDLGKAAVQVSKVGSRGAQGVARGAAGIVRGTPGVAQRAATGLRNLRTPVPASGGMLGRAGSLAGGAARGAGSIVKRIPILGSLISAGFGALDANTEEMERLRAENPGMSDEQINAGLADGSLKKDKAKIIGRSAGAGAGAGVGTVVGGILGSALGPIGTAVGAAAGAWLGENVGKFLGEGFANTFKSFDWGKTFGPVITSFKELAGSITGALDTVAGAFGITGDGEGGSGGFIQALKNIGRIIGVVAKILMKVLAPALQIVAKTIKGVVDVISAVIGGISAFIKGAFGMVKNIINNPIARAIPGVAGIADMISGAESMFSGDVIGNISNFVDGVDTSLPNTEAGNGMGGGFNLLNPLSWFSGKSQKAIESKDKDFSNKTLSGSLLNRRNATNEAIRMMRGQGGGNHSFVPIGRGYGMGGPAVRVTSNRGMRWGKMHQGTDIAPTGNKLHMPLYLPKSATIVDSRSEGNGAGYGNSIYFTTNDGITHLYAHMKNKSRLKVGKTYPAGTQVGLMGYSGNTVPKGPGGTHLHWETGTNEADVGRAGSSLFNPLSKYSKFAPFQGTPSADGADSDYTAESPSASDYSDRGSSPLAVSAVTNPARDFATNVRNTGERLQKSMESQGMETGLAASLGAALAPLGNLKQSLMEAVSAGRPAPGGGSDNSSVSADGDVSMFPTSSPVRDGGHVFAGDV